MGRQRNVDKTLEQDIARTFEQVKPRARPERFERAESHRNLWSYFAVPGSTLDPHLAPSFWSHLVPRLRPLDRIELTEELGAWTALLLVRSVSSEVETVLLNYTAIGGISAVGSKPGFAPEYRITFGGIHSKWCIYQGEKLLIDGLPNERAAESWLEGHVASSPESKGEAA